MKKKRIAAAGLAVIMALTAAGCHQTSKEDTAQTTVKENKEEKDTSKEQIEKEERLQTAIDSIRDQFGFTSLLKANALDGASRSIARSRLIGGHSAGGLDGLK